INRMKAGKPFLMFGSGTETACKPISDDDLATYLVGCIADEARHDRVLPIGGPGPAITPLDQARALATLCDVPLRTRRIPLSLVRGISSMLSGLGRVVPPFADTAELARIAAYYAQESMLVWDDKSGRYDAEATPEFGTTTLFDHYASVVAGDGHYERVTTELF
ncbi:MAG: epimerase, partial [Pseudomonadota bacterium]